MRARPRSQFCEAASRPASGTGTNTPRLAHRRVARSATRTAARWRSGGNAAETKISTSPAEPLRTKALRPGGRLIWRTRITAAFRPSVRCARSLSTIRADHHHPR